jgi:hypothetical protein
MKSSAAFTFRPLLAWALAGAASLLTGCAISTPYRGSTAAPPGGALLIVTHAVVDPAGRSEFFTQTLKVLDSMDGQPGLVGYSVRRQLVGNEVWTMTLWADHGAMVRFVSQPVHWDAMTVSGSAIRSMAVRRRMLPGGAPAPGWAEALRLLQATAP